MITSAEFDDIRPYCDKELSSTVERLLQDTIFRQVLQLIFPKVNWEELTSLLRSIQNIHDFQYRIIKDVVYKVLGNTITAISRGGLEHLQKHKPCVFISNHRDIVLDASLLCILLLEIEFNTAEIAIGDNLLLYPWIEDVVRMNKSFIVKRGVSVRQMLEVSTHLSRYIHFAVRKKKESIWIAQREGRAKDSNDRTQESVLKMLAMGGEQDFLSNLKELNIIPLSISYQYDPCDYLKAKEFQQKRDNPKFKKCQSDDLLNMKTGLSGYKGNIHFQFGQPLRPAFDRLDAEQTKNKLAGTLASLIDKEIFRNYKFYPENYIAYDRLWGKGRFAGQYTEKEIQLFDAYLNKQLEKIDLENKDLPFLTEKILEMYGYPIKNQLEI